MYLTYIYKYTVYATKKYLRLVCGAATVRMLDQTQRKKIQLKKARS